MPSPAVALKEKDDRNISQETGVFPIYTKKLSSNINNSNCNILIIMCLFTLQAMQQCLATIETTTTITTTTMTVDFLKSPPQPYECDSLDLRNNCNDFYKLKNCTVITGYLDIVQLPRKSSDCNFDEYQFENLREITDFLLMNEVRNLTSIKKMFPNLTVIRGQKLILNYALIITSMHHLEKLEFKSLVAIQRGHVLIDDNPKLCYLENVNWNRLTLKRGTNYIFPDKQANCPQISKCNGCKRDSCWSDDVCQKLENDSVISLVQDTSECHSLCLGGCYNRTAQGCVVCKGWSDHGTCVDECPQEKFSSRDYLRCYSREECVNEKELFIYKNTCVEICPSGSKYNNVTRECDLCSGINKCQRVCYPRPGLEPAIYVTHLMSAEELRGCHILNGTVIIYINEYMDEEDLMDSLKDVREIIGHLKISRSPYLTSLKFFKNLKKIHGSLLENKLYSLIIYNNVRLSYLWDPKPGTEFINGGIYIQGNEKLCNRHISIFREKVIHDRSLDSIQASDQEVLCSPAKLNLYVQILNHRSLKFSWPKGQTSAEVEIIYRPMKDKEQLTENSELDTDVCNRIKWRRELKFFHELEDNSTHHSHTVDNLEPHTRYAVLVKTFNGANDFYEARSEIQYITTKFDIPLPPKIAIKNKTYDTLQIEFSLQMKEESSQVVDYYILQVYDIPDDKELLDTRDYCDDPIIIYKDFAHEDYDDCCSRREEERNDKLFLEQMKKDFSCSLDHKDYCRMNYKEYNLDNTKKAILTKRFEAWETNYTIRSLECFHLYVLQVQACNNFGCSSYNMLSTRTNYSITADKMNDFSVCQMSQDYHYRVYFSEPKLPNGYITSYALHFRYQTNDNSTSEHNDLVCITRLEHERHNYFYIARFNYPFNEAAVRIHSLGYHHTFIGWVNITSCSTIKLMGHHIDLWSIILIILLNVVVIILALICYKQEYWRKIRQLCRSPIPDHGGYLRTVGPEERQIFLENFETVRFRNRQDDQPLE